MKRVCDLRTLKLKDEKDVGINVPAADTLIVMLNVASSSLNLTVRLAGGLTTLLSVHDIVWLKTKEEFVKETDLFAVANPLKSCRLCFPTSSFTTMSLCAKNVNDTFPCLTERMSGYEMPQILIHWRSRSMHEVIVELQHVNLWKSTVETGWIWS